MLSSQAKMLWNWIENQFGIDQNWNTRHGATYGVIVDEDNFDELAQDKAIGYGYTEKKYTYDSKEYELVFMPPQKKQDNRGYQGNVQLWEKNGNKYTCKVNLHVNIRTKESVAKTKEYKKFFRI